MKSCCGSVPCGGCGSCLEQQKEMVKDSRKIHYCEICKCEMGIMSKEAWIQMDRKCDACIK